MKTNLLTCSQVPRIRKNYYFSRCFCLVSSPRVFYVEEDEGLRLRLSGDYLSDRALDGLGGACLGDCAHLEDQEEETEGMEDLEVEITV